MNAQVLGIDGGKQGEITLPKVFESNINKGQIMKAFLAEQSEGFQTNYPDPMAGKRKVVYLTKQRRVYRTVYGNSRTRTPKKITYRMGEQFVYTGALAPNTVGGREAHPPVGNKRKIKRINSKERKAALNGLIAASANKDLVARSDMLKEVSFPIVIEDKINDVSKTKDLYNILVKIGLEQEALRLKQRRQRAGRGKMRGRVHKNKVGPLIVTTSPDKLSRAAHNLKIVVKNVRNIDVVSMSRAGNPGRLVIWTRGAIDALGK